MPALEAVGGLKDGNGRRAAIAAGYRSSSSLPPVNYCYGASGGASGPETATGEGRRGCNGDLARYVLAFWHRASNERRFALVAPVVFKKAIEGVLTPTVPNAARILLAALAATRTSVASELRVSLSQIAER